MLANNYLNLYQSDFYRKKVDFFQKSNDKQGLANFEQRFSLANTLYTESLQCVGFTGLDENAVMVIVRESDIINSILSQDQSIFEILRDAKELDNANHPNKRLTCLSVAVHVCEEQLKKMQQHKKTHHR